MTEFVKGEYLKGFEAGWDFALHEVEHWIKREAHDPQRIAAVLSLLAHLKMEQVRENT
jgi:hypothetical protein